MYMKYLLIPLLISATSIVYADDAQLDIKNKVNVGLLSQTVAIH